MSGALVIRRPLSSNSEAQGLGTSRLRTTASWLGLDAGPPCHSWPPDLDTFPNIAEFQVFFCKVEVTIAVSWVNLRITL